MPDSHTRNKVSSCEGKIYGRLASDLQGSSLQSGGEEYISDKSKSPTEKVNTFFITSTLTPCLPFQLSSPMSLLCWKCYNRTITSVPERLNSNSIKHR